MDAIDFHQFSELGSWITYRALLIHHPQEKNCFDAGANRICNIGGGVSGRDAVTSG